MDAGQLLDPRSLTPEDGILNGIFTNVSNVCKKAAQLRKAVCLYIFLYDIKHFHFMLESTDRIKPYKTAHCIYVCQGVCVCVWQRVEPLPSVKALCTPVLRS